MYTCVKRHVWLRYRSEQHMHITERNAVRCRQHMCRLCVVRVTFFWVRYLSLFLVAIIIFFFVLLSLIPFALFFLYLLNSERFPVENETWQEISHTHNMSGGVQFSRRIKRIDGMYFCFVHINIHWPCVCVAAKYI